MDRNALAAQFLAGMIANSALIAATPDPAAWHSDEVALLAWAFHLADGFLARARPAPEQEPP
jgi:hypothetical protein